jgi:hypothetical protein
VEPGGRTSDLALARRSSARVCPHGPQWNPEIVPGIVPAAIYRSWIDGQDVSDEQLIETIEHCLVRAIAFAPGAARDYTASLPAGGGQEACPRRTGAERSKDTSFMRPSVWQRGPRRACARLSRFVMRAAKRPTRVGVRTLAWQPRPSLVRMESLVPLPCGARPPRFPLAGAAPSLFAAIFRPALSRPVRPGVRGSPVVAGRVHRCPVRLALWRGQDSNLRRLSREIYSLVPLTAREPRRAVSECSDQAASVSLRGRPDSTSYAAYFGPPSSNPLPPSTTSAGMSQRRPSPTRTNSQSHRSLENRF